MSTPAEAKDKGNAAFKAGQYAAAVGLYTRAIVLSQSADPPLAVDHTFYLNRAAAYLRLDKFEDAARDCTSALGIRRGDVKALFRRAQARVGMDDEPGARKDLEEALAVEPANQAVKTLLSTLKVKEPVKPKPAPTIAPTVKERTAPSPSSKPPAPSPARRRVPITIVESKSAPQTASAPPAASSSSSKPLPLKSALKPSAPAAPSPSPSSSSDLLTAVSSTRLTPSLARQPAGPPALTAGGSPSSSSATSTAASGAATAPVSTFAAAREAREAKRRVGGGVFRKDGTARIISSDRGAPAAGGMTGGTVNGASSKEGVVERKAPAGAEAASAGKESEVRLDLPPPPRSSSEFARTLTDCPEEARWAYLQLVPPASLPSLFGPALEPDMLASLIRVLAASSAPLPPLVGAYLAALPKVQRFSTIRLFLPAAETERVRRMMDALGVDGEVRRAWGV